MHRIQRTSPSTRRNVCGPVSSREARISRRAAANLSFRIVEEDEAPSGMLARGHYDAASRFVDDDGKDYLKFDWSFDIAKDWK